LLAQAALLTPVDVTKIGFYGEWEIFCAFASLGVLCVYCVGRKRRWGKWRFTWVSFAFVLGSVLVYGNFVNVPESRATRAESDAQLVHEGVYFMYEDHIGRPIMMTQYQDTDGNSSYATTGTGGNEHYIWKANYRPFGQLNDSFGSVGITVGSGNYAISWVPPFRFPGQYADSELPNDMMFYNHFRFYVPSLGRYTSADPVVSMITNSQYSYTSNAPISFVDSNGLEQLPIEVYELGAAGIAAMDPIGSPDDLQTAGDIVGIFDPTPITDGANAIAYFSRGRYWDALASGISMFPFVGDIVGKGGKAICKAGKGWHAGEDITKLTAKGRIPSWSAIRKRFWKNKVISNATEYSAENLQRMKKGFAPQYPNPKNGILESMELHHNPPQRDGGIWDFIEYTIEEHKSVDPFRR
jgi:RHS repeat-associated protein